MFKKIHGRTSNVQLVNNAFFKTRLNDWFMNQFIELNSLHPVTMDNSLLEGKIISK